MSSTAAVYEWGKKGNPNLSNNIANIKRNKIINESFRKPLLALDTRVLTLTVVSKRRSWSKGFG